MTDQIYFDTDCISSFLCVGYENILLQLYKNRIFLPQQVIRELLFVPNFKSRINGLISSKHFQVSPIVYGSPESDLFLKLTANPDPGFNKIGDGEASAISLAKCNDGILGSSNFKDIKQYVYLYKLKHLPTGDILVEAFETGIISAGQGNAIFANMKNHGRMLPTGTFSDYLAYKKTLKT